MKIFMIILSCVVGILFLWWVFSPSAMEVQIKPGQVWTMKLDSTYDPFEYDSVFIKILRCKGGWSEFWLWDIKNKKLEPIDWNEWRSFDRKTDEQIKERFEFYSEW